MGEQGESGVVSSHVSLAERPLGIAVPKGSLFPDAVRVLGEAGLPTDKLRMRDASSSCATATSSTSSSARDAPAFVAHGGADCGICGYDSIFEANHDLIQLVDLRFGGCRFVVAEPRSKAGAARTHTAGAGASRRDQVPAHHPELLRPHRPAGGHRPAPRQHRAGPDRGHDGPPGGHHGHRHNPQGERPRDRGRGHAVHRKILRRTGGSPLRRACIPLCSRQGSHRPWPRTKEKSMRTVTLTGSQRLQQSDLERQGALPREVMESAEKIVDAVREAVTRPCVASASSSTAPAPTRSAFRTRS